MKLKKDSGSLYDNEDGCREFISAPGEMSAINIAEVDLKSNFSSILMDESKIHMREKKVYTARIS